MGTGSGYINTWYDQSGQALNLTQATTSKQPRIVNAGVLDIKNGIPAVYFNGSSSQSMASAAATGISGSQIRSFLVAEIEASPDQTWAYFACLFKSGDASPYQTSTSAALLTMSGTAGNNGAFATFTNNSPNPITVYPGALFQSTTYHDASNNTRNYSSGTAPNTISSTSSIAPTTIIVGTGAGSDSSTYLTGYISELVIYASAVTAANQTKIEKNQDHYYKIVSFDTNGNPTANYTDGFVTTWYDQSGNGYNLTQATTANQPIVDLSTPNPSAYFDGASDYIGSTSFSLTTNVLTAFAAARVQGGVSVPSNGRVISIGKTGDSNDFSNATSSGLILKYGSKMDTVRSGWDLTITPDLVVGQDFQSTVIFDGTNRIIRMKQNGSNSNTTTNNGSGNLIINNVRLGWNMNSGGGHEYWMGNIYEVIFYNSNLNSATYQNIETDENTNYGIN